MVDQVTASMGVSIVIPARNEAAVIGACLDSVARQTHSGLVQVIVVANGCTDDTADIVCSFASTFERRGYELRLVRTGPDSRPAKYSALNAGDAAATHGHRIYLDADVVLCSTALAAIMRAFARDVLFCSPRIELSTVGYFASAYGRVWSALPYVRDDVIGAGCYAVHARGRKRWGQFPDLISDDKFARLQFAPEDRVVVDHTWFQITMPTGFSELVAIRARWLRGNMQLQDRFPSKAAHDQGRVRRAAAFLLSHPTTWPDVPAVATIFLCAEWLAMRQWRARSVRWERADRARTLRAEGKVI